MVQRPGGFSTVSLGLTTLGQPLPQAVFCGFSCTKEPKMRRRWNIMATEITSSRGHVSIPELGGFEVWPSLQHPTCPFLGSCVPVLY